MKILSLFTLVFFCCTTSLMAQSNDADSSSNNRFGIMVGPSFPTGDFASKSPRRSSAAHANTGYLIELNYLHTLSEYIGFKLLLIRNSYDVETQSVVDYFERRTNGAEFNVSSGSFQLLTFMGGIYSQFPINQSSDIYFKMNALFGVVNSTYPQQSIYSRYNSSVIELYSSKEKANSIGYGFGLGLQLPLEENVDFLLNVGFTGTEPRFDDISISTHFDDGTILYDNEDHIQPIQSFNLGIGLAIHL